MAKKKNNEEKRSYMQSFVPEGAGKRYSRERTYFYGLDRRNRADSGYMSDCRNIDVSRLPEVFSASRASVFEPIDTNLGEIVGFYGYDKNLFIALENDTTLTVAKINENGSMNYKSWSLSGDKEKVPEKCVREMAVFCYYEGDDDKMYCEVAPKYYLLVYPDRMCVDVNFSEDAKTVSEYSPYFDHITVWNSRLFGSRDNIVAASCASTPFDWTMDTPEVTDAAGITIGGYDATHAWYSTTQANVKATGDIVAIVAYDGHPIIFKDDYMHQINNNKNPFRVQDIVGVGCSSARSICELDSVLYFASHDGIYRYGGAYPEKISAPLECHNFGKNVVAGGFEGVLYVYNPELSTDCIYTYCPENGLWACIDNPHGNNSIIKFCLCEKGFYSVGEDYKIFKYPGRTNDVGSVNWSLTTDLSILSSADDKRLHSLKVVADGDNIEISVIRQGAGPIVVASSDDLYGTDSLCVMLRKFDGLWHKIKFEGEGEIRIRFMEIVYSVSGERYK